MVHYFFWRDRKFHSGQKECLRKGCWSTGSHLYPVFTHIKYLHAWMCVHVHIYKIYIKSRISPYSVWLMINSTNCIIPCAPSITVETSHSLKSPSTWGINSLGVTMAPPYFSVVPGDRANGRHSTGFRSFADVPASIHLPDNPNPRGRAQTKDGNLQATRGAALASAPSCSALLGNVFAKQKIFASIH